MANKNNITMRDDSASLQLSLFGDSWGVEAAPVPAKKAKEINHPSNANREEIEAGSIWQLGQHFMMCGDSTDAAEVSRLVATAGVGKIELMFTSPPYSTLRTYDGADCSIDKLAKIFGAWREHTNFFAVNLGLRFKDGAVIQYWDEWIAGAQSEGLKMLAWNVWDKMTGGGIGSATNMFLLTHEWIFVFGQKRKRLIRTIPNNVKQYESRHGKNWQEGKTRKAREQDGSFSLAPSPCHTHHQIHSVVQKTPEQGDIRGKHPATMPVGLPVQYIEAFAEKDQIVADCFMGSGTTLIACEQLGRTCLGMEISPKYFEVILDRWEKFTGKTAKRIC